MLVESTDQYIVGVPQNNGAYFDGTYYWIFYQEATTLKCVYGTALSMMSQTGGNLVENVANNGKSYSVVFGQLGGVYYAWVLVNRSATTSGEVSNVYRWELTASGLGAVSSHIDAAGTDLLIGHSWLSKNPGSSITELLRCVSDVNLGDNSQISGALAGDTSAVDWNPASITFPEHQLMFKLSDGYLGIANNQGGEADSANAYEVTKALIGDAWSGETALGWTDQSYATNTSHAGEQDFVQLDNGIIYAAYIDDTNADYGSVIINKRGAAVAGTWSSVSTDATGGNAWHISLSTDGTNIWLVYCPDSGVGLRGTTLCYRKLTTSTDSIGSETELAKIRAGFAFNRMTSALRSNEKIVVLWSEVFGARYDLCAAAINI